MAFQETIFNTALDAMADRVTQLSLHTGDPGGTGANELTGGTYARQAVTWNAATSAQVTIAAPVTFGVAAGNTIEWVGMWDGMTWVGAVALNAPQPFPNDGELTVQNLAITMSNL